jgi:hypothetical protein
MGEMECKRKVLVEAVDGALQEAEQAAAELRVATPGGRFRNMSTSYGQLILR